MLCVTLNDIGVQRLPAVSSSVVGVELGVGAGLLVVSGAGEVAVEKIG